MPVHPDPSRHGWQVLVDPAGNALGRFIDGERHGGRVADLFELATDVEPASEARPVPDGLALRPADRTAADLVDAYRSAFPPTHPDGAARIAEDTEPTENLAAGHHGVVVDGFRLWIS